jgi:hypothetical protein
MEMSGQLYTLTTLRMGGGHQSQSGCFGEEKNLLHILKIEIGTEQQL